MEHRCSLRKPIELRLLLYKHGLPVKIGICRNLGLGGLFVETVGYEWRKQEALQVELVGYNGKPSMRLPAVLIHHSECGAGLMFHAVSSEQRRVLCGWLFGGRDQRPTVSDALEQGSCRAVAWVKHRQSSESPLGIMALTQAVP